MTAALALLASLLWGVSDFLGGTASRRLRVGDVIVVSQICELVLLVPIALAFGIGTAPSVVFYGIAAGICSVLALQAFYQALADGTMGIVAPVAALSAVVPVCVSVLTGHVPSTLQNGGLIISLAGTVLVTGPKRGAASPGRPLALAGLSAIGFGAVNVFLAGASQHSVIGGLLLMRLTSATALIGLRLMARQRLMFELSDLPLLGVIGVADLMANAMFALATTVGILAVAAVLASLYPAVTALLARQVHKERLRTVQWCGVGFVLVGVATVAAATSR